MPSPRCVPKAMCFTFSQLHLYRSAAYADLAPLAGGVPTICRGDSGDDLIWGLMRVITDGDGIDIMMAAEWVQTMTGYGPVRARQY